jgi:hypothetical protein
VDFDPVDVPAIDVPGEGISRGFEAYSLENQENGFIELAEGVVGYYPVACIYADVDPVMVYAPTATDVGNMGVVDPEDLSIQKLYRDGTEDPTPGGLPTHMESSAGITVDTTPVASDRVGLVLREFFPGPDPGQRVRVEEGKQYFVRFHVTSTSNANTNPQIRLRVRSIKFMWSQKYELGGAFATDGGTAIIAQQALPGIGCLNPDQETPGEPGGWYTVIAHTPMSLDIRPDETGPLSNRMPLITGQPGPGDDSPSMRDLRVGFDVIDTLSWGMDYPTEAGDFTFDRIEVRTYDLVPD